MKRLKKLLALALTGAMVLSCTVFASATSNLGGSGTNANSGNASGTGSSEGPLPAETVAVVLPTSVAHDYDMILDPHHLLKDTAYQRFGNVWGDVVTGQDDNGNDITEPGYTTENVRFSNEDAKLFFKNADAQEAVEAVAAVVDDQTGETITEAVEAKDAVPALYSNVTNERKIINKGLMDINVELDIAITKGDADFVSFVESADDLVDNGEDGAQVYFALQSQNLEVAAEGDAATAAPMPTQVTVGGTGNLLTSAAVEYGADADAAVFTDAAITLTATDVNGDGYATQYTVTSSDLTGYALALAGDAITVSETDGDTGDTITLATITLTGLVELTAANSINDTAASTLTFSLPSADGEIPSVTKAVGEDGTASISGKIGHLGWDTVTNPDPNAGFRKIWQWNEGSTTEGAYVYDRTEQDESKYPSATYNLTGAINEHDDWDGYAVGKDTFKVDLTWKITKDGETVSGGSTGGSTANANAEPTVKVTSVAAGDYVPNTASTHIDANKTVLALTLGSGTNEYTIVHKLTFKNATGTELNWIIEKQSTDTNNPNANIELSSDKKTLTVNGLSAFRAGNSWAIEFMKADGTTKSVSFTATQVG